MAGEKRGAEAGASGAPGATAPSFSELLNAASALRDALKELTGAAEEAGWDVGENAEVLSRAREALCVAECIP